MNQSDILVEEQADLAEEILDKGPNEGRGIRLAALVIRLHEAIARGHLPRMWEHEREPITQKVPVVVMPTPLPKVIIEDYSEVQESELLDPRGRRLPPRPTKKR